MRHTSFFVLSIAATALLAGCSTAAAPPSAESTSPTTSPTTPSTPEPAPAPDASESFTLGAPDGQCLTENLTVTVAEQGSSAGHLHYDVIFTNTGSECVLEGFPGIQVTNGGAALGAAATEDSRTTPVGVSLTRGGSTAAELSVTNIASGGGPLGDACTVEQGDAFAVTPPHSTIAIPVPMPGVSACSNGTPWMTVGPVLNQGVT